MVAIDKATHVDLIHLASENSSNMSVFNKKVANRTLDQELNRKFPGFADIERAALKRMPKFIRDYVAGGIGSDLNVRRNREDLDTVQMCPDYLIDTDDVDSSTSLFEQDYDAPFGVSPVGLGDLAWPKSAQFIASAACAHNIPFGASIFTLCSLETIQQYAKGCAWFQLYHPLESNVTESLLDRAKKAGYRVLLVTVDVPSPTRRDHDIRNGFTLPIHIGLSNCLEVIKHPKWAMAAMNTGFPVFENFSPYIDGSVGKNQALRTASDMLAGHVSIGMLKDLRRVWNGKLVVKGVLNSEEAKKVRDIGVDGIVISNHGGRQLEAAPSPVRVLPAIRQAVGSSFPLIAEGGVRSGLDICRLLALGADFVMMGRPYYYAVAAMGERGARHIMNIFNAELRCTMGQLGCSSLEEINSRLLDD